MIEVMIWNVITYDSRSPLMFVRGTMIAHRYAQEIVEPYLT